MKGVDKNREINEELKVENSEKGKTWSEGQQDLQQGEIIERKQQLVEETTVQKEYHSISETIINKRMESKIARNKITYNMNIIGAKVHDKWNKNIWGIHPWKRLSHRNKETKVVKN